MDVGVAYEYDLEETVAAVLDVSPNAPDLTAFRDALASAKEILFLTDNAGETAFDRVLSETLDKPVTCVVKSCPILNDATTTEALAPGLGDVAAIVESGSDAPGTALDLCGPDLRRRFADSDLIIAKGQANCETLSEVPGPVFVLFQAKCQVDARDLGVPLRSAILKRSAYWAPGPI